MRSSSSLAIWRFALPCVASALAACSSSDSTGPDTTSDVLQLTTKQVGSLDSTGQVITQANPGNANLKALVDSTLLVLTAGVQAKRLDVSTNLTTKPLYFVGVHRAVTTGSGSFSTWTLVGIDDPSNLASLVEVSGFAAGTSGTPPTSVSGTIGAGGGGIVNGMLLAVAAGGAVTEWSAATGTASFSSDAPGAACPNFTPTANITCKLETMHVHFTLNAPSGTGGAGARQAGVGVDVDVPAMRLTYTF
jgi:hypothetical protein